MNEIITDGHANKKLAEEKGTSTTDIKVIHSDPAPQQFVKPSLKAGLFRRRSDSWLNRPNFGKIGLRKPVVNKSMLESRKMLPLHRRAHTLMHLSNIRSLSPSSSEGTNTAAKDELKRVVDNLVEQFGETEQRVEKQLAALHKRFEKMEKMQLAILSTIKKISCSYSDSPPPITRF